MAHNHVQDLFVDIMQSNVEIIHCMQIKIYSLRTDRSKTDILRKARLIFIEYCLFECFRLRLASPSEESILRHKRKRRFLEVTLT
jgi:hypothetical protein